MNKRPYKVLHAPSSVGGNPQTLSRALRQLGVDSQSLVVSQNYMAYPADIELHRPGQSFLMRELKRVWTIFFLLPRFDVIHYNAGTTVASAYAFQLKAKHGLKGGVRFLFAAYLRMLQRLEIAYVTALGKRIFFTFQGDDARQGDYSRAHFPISIVHQVDEGYYDEVSDSFKRRIIARFAKIADRIYAVNPDLLHVLPRDAIFVPYSHILIDEWLPSYTQAEARPLRIVHAPSHRKVKGTDIILSTLEKLKQQGFEFELLLVEGMSHAQARETYEKADVLIDQLFAGWYGGLAVELMALGKPVLVYIREEDLHFIPSQMKADLPFLNATSDSLESVLRKLMEMPRAELVSLGKRSREFVERWHDPIRIAESTKADYEQSFASAERGA
jgi:hypothetical protein